MLPSATQAVPLPALIQRAIVALDSARTAAEVLEARDLAALAYDAAKLEARLHKAKRAHDDLIAASYRVQGDALQIEANAKRRLADEYDAAQERGEAQKPGGDRKSIKVPDRNNDRATAADLGLSRKDIHEARVIRDAEAEDPGIVKRTLDEAIAAGEEPTRAKVRRVALQTRKAKHRPRKPASNYQPESQHERDLRMLRDVWSAACASAQEAFLRELTNT